MAPVLKTGLAKRKENMAAIGLGMGFEWDVEGRPGVEMLRCLKSLNFRDVSGLSRFGTRIQSRDM